MRQTNQQKVKRFIETTCASDRVAREFLKKYNWEVERAVDEFFGSEISNQQQNDVFLSIADPEGKDPSLAVMDAEGVERLCDALGIEPVDPRILVFCQACDAATMGSFTKQEFLKGLHAFRASSIADLKTASASWDETLSSPETARPVYRFLFKYALEEHYKSLPLDAAKEYWQMLLPPLNFPLYDEWIKYVDEVLGKKENAQVSKDVWNMTFDFLRETKMEDIAAFDLDASAWPSVVDEFVEWERSKVEA